MKVFITGATGLLGSFICKELINRGHTVRAMKRSSSQMTLLGATSAEIDWVEGDMNDLSLLEEALEGIEAVIHGAAIISFDKRYAEKMYQTNVLGTADLVNACLKKDLKNFIHISSVAALGRKEGQKYIDENDRWEGNAYDSIYARSKHQQELEVWRGAQEGLEVKIINPSVVLGPGLWGSSGSTSVFHYAHSEKAFYPAGNINVVDVRDVAEVAVKLLTSPVKNERFVLSADSMPFGEFFGKIAEAFGKKKPQKVVKPWMLKVVVPLEFIRSRITGSEAMVTKDTAKLSKTKYHFKNDKVKEVLNFEFRKVNESINWTVKELQNRHDI